ncbi:cbb3-type cytochrome oxidase assembly protein CcoS [Nitratiruptor sp. YY09-18]|uniref:cbb3-type cytochrome oxidase assembly protein CcoS n=1 Tax=Nitratiruptor sp. YY09-18 TaxID=2724901 RepID=UPI001915C127|nr:cbb3-type cytochrome oxidase assembly protein CcoS [Nitratiruptor sp. YY09-18]BCD67613.1 type cbb3 cytochrome oxidase biogenesis protein CcoS, involved in heme b insertion [Nitratiruptor sp. YY09-18]
MDAWVIAMMIFISTLLGAFGLFALIWGLKTGQFDDTTKFLDGARFDGEEELKDAVMMEEKKKELERRRKDRRIMPH